MKFNLKEKKQDEIFKEEQNLGDYFIGSEISFGIHIPAPNRQVAESIMKSCKNALKIYYGATKID